MVSIKRISEEDEQGTYLDSKWIPLYTGVRFAVHTDLDGEEPKYGRLLGVPAKLCHTCRIEWHDNYLDFINFDYLRFNSPEQLSQAITHHLTKEYPKIGMKKDLAEWGRWKTEVEDLDHMCEVTIGTARNINLAYQTAMYANTLDPRASDVDNNDYDWICECPCDK
tara:strand:+ start:89 stop:586 length:498 start_codon:yes stop_codon:yes gene_type:complete